MLLPEINSCEFDGRYKVQRRLETSSPDTNRAVLPLYRLQRAKLCNVVVPGVPGQGVSLLAQ